ncbi:malectin domain-containing carbohydrate-binding protein [uncultured Hymenobacter sp.]|uniref:malectin domain-containing carbohydrate-binding protein n=1 Tax=uncultured Hymenobacter sp. TaxID=170016 RepID=UPI0035CC3F44
MLTLLALLGALCATPVAAGDTVRIDCGSTQSYRTVDGRLFAADQFFVNGQASSNPAVVDIAGTTDDVLYRTERYGVAGQAPMRYNIAVPSGDYLIRMHFAEVHHGATGGAPGGPGQRVFSVQLEGRRVVINYDLYAAVGAMTAVVQESRASITDGQATLDFVPAAGNPTIAALEVLRLPTGSVPPPACTWTPRATINLGYKEGQCAVVGPYFYTFGGYSFDPSRGLEATNVSRRYDLATDQWTSLPPMPLPTTHTAAALVGPAVWIVGGYVGNWPGIVTDAVQIYDTQANTWRLGPPLPQRRGSGAAALVGRQLHFFGGVEPDIQTDSPLHFVLDLDNEVAGWRVAAPLPLPRCHLGGATLGGKLYALGGQHGHNISVNNTALVHEYDPLADTWTRRADLPTIRSHFEGTVTVLDGRILTVGGIDSYTNHEDVLSYDPAANRWTKVCELPVPLGGAFAKVLNNTLIVSQGEINGTIGPEAITRTAPLSSIPSNVLRFSREQLAAQVAPGGTATLPNLLWTLSGTATYVLAPNAWPAWLTLAPSPAGSTTDPLGRDITFRVNATGLAPGTYTATVQATAPGYTMATTTVVLTVALPMATHATSLAVPTVVFPNPATDQATLQFGALSKQTALVELRNSLGQLVWRGSYSATSGENHFDLSTSKWAPGVYQVRVYLREGPLSARLLLTR